MQRDRYDKEFLYEFSLLKQVATRLPWFAVLGAAAFSERLFYTTFQIQTERPVRRDSYHEQEEQPPTFQLWTRIAGRQQVIEHYLADDLHALRKAGNQSRHNTRAHGPRDAADAIETAERVLNSFLPVAYERKCERCDGRERVVVGEMLRTPVGTPWFACSSCGTDLRACDERMFIRLEYRRLHDLTVVDIAGNFVHRPGCRLAPEDARYATPNEARTLLSEPFFCGTCAPVFAQGRGGRPSRGHHAD